MTAEDKKLNVRSQVSFQIPAKTQQQNGFRTGVSHLLLELITRQHLFLESTSSTKIGSTIAGERMTQLLISLPTSKYQ